MKLPSIDLSLLPVFKHKVSPIHSPNSIHYGSGQVWWGCEEKAKKWEFVRQHLEERNKIWIEHSLLLLLLPFFMIENPASEKCWPHGKKRKMRDEQLFHFLLHSSVFTWTGKCFDNNCGFEPTSSAKQTTAEGVRCVRFISPALLDFQ